MQFTCSLDQGSQTWSKQTLPGSSPQRSNGNGNGRETVLPTDGNGPGAPVVRGYPGASTSLRPERIMDSESLPVSMSVGSRNSSSPVNSRCIRCPSWICHSAGSGEITAVTGSGLSAGRHVAVHPGRSRCRYSCGPQTRMYASAEHPSARPGSTREPPAVPGIGRSVSSPG